jgi:hypothetical protein
MFHQVYVFPTFVLHFLSLENQSFTFIFILFRKKEHGSVHILALETFLILCVTSEPITHFYACCHAWIPAAIFFLGKQLLSDGICCSPVTELIAFAFCALLKHYV